MSLVLELPGELLALLNNAAQTQGVPVEKLAGEMLALAVSTNGTNGNGHGETIRFQPPHIMSQEERSAFVAERKAMALAAGGEGYAVMEMPPDKSNPIAGYTNLGEAILDVLKPW